MTIRSARVECYSGSTYAERPVAVHWQGQSLAVQHVLRIWRTPAGPGFEVAAMDSRRFRLQLDEAADVWHVQEITTDQANTVESALT